MEKYPGISVIIPTFNREGFLAEAINSILIQDYNGVIEIIVSDDGSTDNSLKIASQFGEKVKIINKPGNCLSQGAAGSRNRGLSAATQSLICFLDSDDFFLKDHFKKMVIVLLKNPDLSFVFCRVLECTEKNGKRLFRQWTYPQVNKRDIKNPVVSRSHIVHTNSFIFKKEVFENVGVFNETYSNGEDGDLWMRISEVYKGGFSNHFGAVYNSSHGELQLTKRKQEIIKRDSMIIFKNAVHRYYQLKLKDTFRIFKLKHHLLIILYNNNKSMYYTKYVNLILHYPISIGYVVMDYFYNFQKRKENTFRDLSHYIN